MSQPVNVIDRMEGVYYQMLRIGGEPQKVVCGSKAMSAYQHELRLMGLDVSQPLTFKGMEVSTSPECPEESIFMLPAPSEGNALRSVLAGERL